MAFVSRKKADADPAEASAVERGSGKLILFAIKFAVSATLVGYLLTQLDFRLPPLTPRVGLLLAACVGLLLLQPLIMAVRWWRLMREAGLDVSLRDAVRFNWIAVFANQFLPASVGGDAVRIVLCRMSGLSIRRATMTVLFDRGFALCALVFLIIVLVPAVSASVDTNVVLYLAGAVFAASVATLVALAYLAPFASAFASNCPRTAFLARYIDGFSMLASNWPVTITAFGLSIVVHLLSFTAFALIAYCFGVDLPVLELLAINSLITLAQILPVSLAGWGVREGAAVVLFSNVGVDSSTALSISLLAGVSFALASLPGAVLWLLRPTR